MGVRFPQLKLGGNHVARLRPPLRLRRASVRIAWSSRHVRRPGSPPERARAIRLLPAGAVVVAVVLCGQCRTRPGALGAKSAMWAAALFLRGARAVAAIRAR